jgi:hypothetical protein
VNMLMRFLLAVLLTFFSLVVSVHAQSLSAPASAPGGNYTVTPSTNLYYTDYYGEWVETVALVEWTNGSNTGWWNTGSSVSISSKPPGTYTYQLLHIIAYYAGGESVSYLAEVTVVVPENTDYDYDGCPNSSDAFPYNPAECIDTDGDGTGNNSDTDDDNDGMPDSWENSFGLNPLVSDGSLDPDRDGATNWSEYQDGTQPRNLLSCYPGLGCNYSPAPSPASINYPGVDNASDQIGAIAASFDVSSSGNVEYTIPLYTPAGTAGLAPKLALQYRSNGGTGLVGQGWSIGGLSMIARCPQTRAQDGQVVPVTMTPTDRFCLDGERLVLVNSSATYGGNNVEYRTETDRFSKIISYGDGVHPFYFIVWHKDGSVSEYGNSSTSKLIDAASGKIRVWGQNRIENRLSKDSPYNDAVVYNYNASPSISDFRIETIQYAFANTTNSPNVTIAFSYNARPDPQALLSRHLSSIQVSTYQPAGPAVLRTYNLNYVNVGSAHNKTSKPSWIMECVGAYCLSPTTFTWSDTGIDFAVTSAGTISGLSTFPYTAEDMHRYASTDFNGDGKGDLIWLEPDGGNYRFKASLSNGSALAAPSTQSQNAHDIDAWTMADYNQDGYPDILFTVNGTLYAYLNTLVSGQRSFAVAPIQLIANLDQGTEPTLDGAWFAPKGIFADINADGLMDVMYNKAIYYMELDPQQTHGPYKFGAANVVTLGSPSVTTTLNGKAKLGAYNQNSITAYYLKTIDLDTANFSGDFNGDGMPDLVATLRCADTVNANFPCGKAILTNKGSAGWDYFDVSNIYTAVYGTMPTTTLPADDRPVSIGDINGDGLADLIWFRARVDDRWYYHLSDHTRMARSLQSIILPTGTVEVGLQDLNLDGLSDLVYREVASGDDPIKVLFSKGAPQNDIFPSASTAPMFASVGGSNAGNHTFIDRFGDASIDINGDGILDFIDLSTNIWHGNKASGTAWNKITKITDGLGAEINITYDQLSNSTVYTREFDAPTLNLGAPVIDIFAPINVVSSTSRSAPIAGNANYLRSTSYQYQGLKIQPAGRGSLGFRMMKATDNETGNTVVNSFRQDYPFIGLLGNTQTLVNGQSTPLSETTNTYAKLTHINGLTTPPYLVALTQSVTTQRVAESSPTASTPAVTINGVLTTTTTSQSNIDSYGNAGTVAVTITGDGSTHTTTTTSTYSNNASNWLIGKLTNVVVTRQLGSSTNTRTTALHVRQLRAAADRSARTPGKQCRQADDELRVRCFRQPEQNYGNLGRWVALFTARLRFEGPLR